MIARMMLLISFRSGHCFLHFRMREWLSGGASPSQGEGRGFESRLALIFTKLPDGLPESFFIKGKKNMDVFIWILDVVGTIAFSISGAMVGIRKKMDLFGVCVLGVVTATGGGMTRDIVLGINPPRMFTNSTDVLIAAVTAILTFIVIHYANKKKQTHVGFREMYSLVLFVMDTLGLAIFTVIGIEVALATRPDAGNFLLVFVGTITGVGGGLLRDMMSESIPYIFQKHIYATACIVGALICVIFYRKLNISLNISMIVGAIAVLVIRALAAQLRWNLPTIHLDEEGKS